MWLNLASVLALLFCVGGCAVAPPAIEAPDHVWHDQAFGYTPSLVSANSKSVFALDADLARSLREASVAHQNESTRLAHLMSLIFGPDLKAFDYAGGHSTVAADTWRNKRGDCLSLTIMSYSIAKALDLPVQMQEVRVPVVFDRRGGVDFLNNHVNVLIRNDRPLRLAGRTVPGGDVLVDFEPQVGSKQRGRSLSDDAILARFFNNIASEHLAMGRNDLAYAHFKTAIQADPSYSASYSNLAQLYLATGLTQSAERLLRHAVSMNDRADLAMASLHGLLMSQGHDAEAQHYAALLQTRRDQDPYHWLGLGMERMQQERFAEAVDALERAQALTSGFDEVHRHLAVAYWRVGKVHKARDQLAILSALDRGDASVATLGKKFKRNPADGGWQ